MRPWIGTWMGRLASAILVAACAGSSGPSASSPAPTAVPSGPAATDYILRATTTQAIPPATRFAWLPLVTITDDLRLVVPGPMIEIYPGPLLPNLLAQSVSAGGFQRIVDNAHTLGLFTGDGDFTPDTVALGSTLGRVEIVVDGLRHDLTGDPSRIVRCGDIRCLPAPGTPEAFARSGAPCPTWRGSRPSWASRSQTLPTPTPSWSASSGATIRPSSPVSRCGRWTCRWRNSAGRSAGARPPAAARSGVPMPLPYGPPSPRRTGSRGGSTRRRVRAGARHPGPADGPRRGRLPGAVRPCRLTPRSTV